MTLPLRREQKWGYGPSPSPMHLGLNNRPSVPTLPLTVTALSTPFVQIPVKQPRATYGTAMQFRKCVKWKLTHNQNRQMLHNGRGQIKTAVWIWELRMITIIWALLCAATWTQSTLSPAPYKVSVTAPSICIQCQCPTHHRYLGQKWSTCRTSGSPCTGTRSTWR